MVDYNHAKNKWELEQITRGGRPEVAKIRKYSTPELAKLLSKIRQLPSLMEG